MPDSPDSPDSEARTTFTRELHIDAPRETVFSYFTDPAKMARWIGIEHRLDPVPGGTLRVDVNGRNVAAGQFVVVEPPARVVFTWGWEANEELPPGSSTVDVRLTAEGDKTIVHFVHRDLSPVQAERHGEGWDHFLARLGVAAAGGDPGPDPYLDPSP
jgi:uncharacterized protein YndB with AHSA1/START domain